MKNKKVLVILGLLAGLIILSSCSPAPEVNYEEFQVWEECITSDTPPFEGWTNKNAEGKYCYYIEWIVKTPNEYSAYKNSAVFYIAESYPFGNMWYKSNKDKVEEELHKGNFKIIDVYGNNAIQLTKLKNEL